MLPPYNWLLSCQEASPKQQEPSDLERYIREGTNITIKETQIIIFSPLTLSIHINCCFQSLQILLKVLSTELLSATSNSLRSSFVVYAKTLFGFFLVPSFSSPSALALLFFVLSASSSGPMSSTETSSSSFDPSSVLSTNASSSLFS